MINVQSFGAKMLLIKLVLMIGSIVSINLHCADRGEDSKSAAPAPTSPREQYVQIKSIKDLETFTKSVVAFRGDNWLDEDNPELLVDEEVDNRHRLSLEGYHYAYIEGCKFDMAPKSVMRLGSLINQPVILSDDRLRDSSTDHARSDRDHRSSPPCG